MRLKTGGGEGVGAGMMLVIYIKKNSGCSVKCSPNCLIDYSIYVFVYGSFRGEDRLIKESLLQIILCTNNTNNGNKEVKSFQNAVGPGKNI